MQDAFSVIDRLLNPIKRVFKHQNFITNCKLLRVCDIISKTNDYTMNIRTYVTGERTVYYNLKTLGLRYITDLSMFHK